MAYDGRAIQQPARRRPMPGSLNGAGAPHFAWGRPERRVSGFYFYLCQGTSVSAHWRP